MMDVGRLCLKIAGRDAGNKCVIVEVVDKNHVLIDGAVRRRKCNIHHLEPFEQVLEIKKGASSEDLKKEFDKLGIEMRTSKPKKASEKPRQIRSADRKKSKEVVTPAKKSEKKVEFKDEKTAVKEASVPKEKPEEKTEAKE